MNRKQIADTYIFVKKQKVYIYADTNVFVKKKDLLVIFEIPTRFNIS